MTDLEEPTEPGSSSVDRWHDETSADISRAAAKIRDNGTRDLTAMEKTSAELRGIEPDGQLVVSQSGEATPRPWYSSIVQRWYLVLFWAVVLALGVAAVFVAVPTQYQATGQLLILPPAQTLGEGEQRRNTYLLLPDGNVLTAILVADTVNQPDVARELIDDGFTSTYTVGVVPGTGPLITITVKDVDPLQALALRDEILDRLEAELDRIQTAEDVPTSQLMEARRFNTSSQAEELTGSRIRAVIAVVVASVVLAALSITAVDRRAFRRVAASKPRPSPPSHRREQHGPQPVRQHQARVLRSVERMPDATGPHPIDGRSRA